MDPIITWIDNMLVTRSNASGWVDIAVVVDAVNSLPEDARRAVVDALRECEPRVRWYVTAAGRLDAVWT